MSTDSSRKPTRRTPSKRSTSSSSTQHKPTKRGSARRATSADSHYSKLARISTRESTARRSGSKDSPARDKSHPSSRTRDNYRATRKPSSPRKDAAAAGPVGFETLSSDTKRRVWGNKAPRRRTGNTAALLVGIAVIVALVGGGFFFWTHRSVRITVNGSTEHMRVKSTLADIYEQLGLNTRPGNYVSVGGNLLQEDGGYHYSVTLDGKELSPQEADEYRLRGGEQIAFGDGGDRTEDYDIEYRETQPKLVFEGSVGAVSFIKQWGAVGKQEIRTGKDSGETVDGDWVDELKDCIVVTKNIAPADGQKLVALTFDDGPAATYTEAYLDILAEHDAKATFFNLSSNEEQLPELARKVAESGNQLCSHTNQHLDLTTLGQEELIAEITSARETIASLTGVDTTVIRPPYGSFNQSCWLMSQGAMTVSVLWNQDTVDWSQPGSDAIVENALAGVQPGSIILMHDGGGERSQDIEALPQIIESLQKDGYKLVTLSELLASDPDVPAKIAAGNAQMPKSAVWPTEIGEATTSA